MSRLSYTRRKPHPACVSDFLERTRVGTESIKKEMGLLSKEGIDEQEFHELCLHLANGIQYIFDKHNVAPKNIIFKDQLEDDKVEDGVKPLLFDREENAMALYDPATQTIEISRAWFKDIILNPDQDFFADRMNEEYAITREQDVFLTGFEEANHHKQKYGGSRAQRKGFLTIDNKPTEDAYWNDPHELANRKEQLAVARELGMIPKIARR